MANVTNVELVHDGHRNVVYRLDGVLDTSDVAVADFTTISSLSPVPTYLRLDRVEYSVQDALSVRLWWHATADDLIIPLEGRGKFDFDWFGGLQNPKSAGNTGNARYDTKGWSAGAVLGYTLILEFSKQGTSAY